MAMPSGSCNYLVSSVGELARSIRDRSYSQDKWDSKLVPPTSDLDWGNLGYLHGFEKLLFVNIKLSRFSTDLETEQESG